MVDAPLPQNPVYQRMTADGAVLEGRTSVSQLVGL